MITVGVDFHKRTSTYCVLDESGYVIKQCKRINEREDMRAFIGDISGPKQIALEATRNWGLYHDSISDMVDAFYLGHPRKMKAITESERKNDSRDAEMIARMTQSGFLPQAHVSCSDTRQMRSLLRFRHALVNQRRSIRNQVHAVVDRNFFPSEKPQTFKDVFCRRGRAWLASAKFPERERFIIQECLKEYDRLSESIDNIARYVREQPLHLAGMEYLKTVPGFAGGINAYIVLLEADDIGRFSKAHGFAAYCGLIPSEHSSGDKHRTGRLVKQANMFLRTAFIESTLAAIRKEPRLRSYYRQVKERAGSSAAVVATARKLAFAVYHVLKDRTVFNVERLVSSTTAYQLRANSSVIRNN